MSAVARKFAEPQGEPENVEDLVRRLDALPTLPSIIHELNRIVNDPMSSAMALTKVMEKDQSLTAKVLKLINSAYYSIPGGVASLSRAIAYLGFDTVNQLALAASAVNTIGRGGHGEFDMAQFWKHTIAVAMVAENVGKLCKHKNPAECFTAGLLHDLGKVALCHVAPKQLGQIVAKARADRTTFLEAEKKFHLLPHVVLGSMVAKNWQLPESIQGAILYHHEPKLEKRFNLREENHKMVDIVIFANILVHEIGFGYSGHDCSEVIDEALLKRLGLSRHQVMPVMKRMVENLASADEFIKIIS